MHLGKFVPIDFTPNATFWVVIALVLPGTLIVFGAVIAFIVRRNSRQEMQQGIAGYYRVLGVDATSGERRESFFHADSRSAAEGRARLEGIIPTEIHRIDDDSSLKGSTN